MERMLHDVRYAVRSLLRARSYAVVAVLTLALGIGANATIFSVIDGVLLRPLPYEDPDRVVRLVPRHVERGESDLTFSYPDLLEMREARGGRGPHDRAAGGVRAGARDEVAVRSAGSAAAVRIRDDPSHARSSQPPGAGFAEAAQPVMLQRDSNWRRAWHNASFTRTNAFQAGRRIRR